MTRHASSHAHRAKSSHAGQLPMMMSSTQFEAMLAANRCFLQVAEEITQSMMSAMQDVGASGSDLATKLCRCGNPTEAAGLCNQWWSERTAKLAEQSQRTAELWMKLYRSALQSGEAVATGMSDRRPLEPVEPKTPAEAA